MFWTRDTLRCQRLETWPLQNHLSTLCEYKTESECLEFPGNLGVISVLLFIFGEFKEYLGLGLFFELIYLKSLFLMACVYFCDAKCNLYKLFVYMCIYL